MPNTVNLYTPRYLMGVIRNVPVKPQFVRDTVFKGQILHNTEKIDVDVVQGTRKIAPYVSPIKQGVIVGREGFSTQTFQPGYTKVKRALSGDDVINRQPGENIYDPLSPDERARAQLVQDATDLNDMIDLAEEVQACEGFTTGKVTLRDENNVAVKSVDLGMLSTHKVTLSGTDLWSATATADPIQDIQDWILMLQEDSGSNPDFILMAPNVAKAFMAYFQAQKDEARMNALTLNRGQLSPTAPAAPGGATYLGNLPEIGVPMYSYASKYTDLAGNVQPLIPAGKIVVASIDGMQAKKQYGMIRDVDALYATSRFSKAWVDPDPGVRYFMVQSAPFMNPYNVNAYMFASVL